MACRSVQLTLRAHPNVAFSSWNRRQTWHVDTCKIIGVNELSNCRERGKRTPERLAAGWRRILYSPDGQNAIRAEKTAIRPRWDTYLFCLPAAGEKRGIIKASKLRSIHSTSTTWPTIILLTHLYLYCPLFSDSPTFQTHRYHCNASVCNIAEASKAQWYVWRKRKLRSLLVGATIQ